MTNFEKIKEMTLNEAANEFNKFKKNKCKYCIYNNDYDDCHADFCHTATKRWLESEE